ncbi:MAG: folate family ECF transporter S component [Oscillospiraceae bacterium]|nr:folate family ECF transporter S component [Oscillospiraceae bacterium]
MQNRIKSSAGELKNTRSLAICAVLVALYVAINSASIYVTPSLKLTFSYLVLGILGYKFGIVTGFFAGFACDLIAYVVRPAGPLHLGFTLSTMLTVVIFALFLYRRELKLWRIILSRTLINLLINIALNTYWLSNLYGKAYVVLLFERVIKNIALLPVEIALLWFVLKAFEKIMTSIDDMR